MSDFIVSTEPIVEEDWSRPPLYLQHYLDEREQRGLEAQVFKPPGTKTRARVIERRDNLIVLEFHETPLARPKRRSLLRHLCRNGWDAAMLLLLLASAAACVASFVR